MKYLIGFIFLGFLSSCDGWTDSGGNYLYTCDICTQENRDYFSTSKVIFHCIDDDVLKKEFGVPFIDTYYYDNRGNMHKHSYSSWAAEFTCSNNHRWEIIYFFECGGCTNWPSGYKKFVDGKCK